jgi:histidinol-phosphate aminotransferase
MTGAKLQIRKNVLDYQRDTYLGSSPVISKEFDLLDCSVGYSQWGVSPKVIQAYQQFDPEAVCCYPEMFYDKLLKPLIIAKFCGADIEPNQLFFGHGSFNLAERLIHKFIPPTTMLGVGPQFNEIPSEFVAAGGKYLPVEINITDYSFPLERLIQALRLGNYATLYLDNPNNPLGRLVSICDIEELARVAAETGTIVIVDEAYGDFVPDECSAVYLVNKVNNLAVIRSFSKCLGLAAERIGYMFLSKKMVSLYSQLDVPFEPGIYGAVMAEATLRDVDFVEKIRVAVARTKHEIVACLMKAGYLILPTHEATSILTVHKKDFDVVAEFASIGIAIEPGSAYKKTHRLFDDSFCRIRIPNTSEEFQRRLQRLEKR